MMDQIILEKQEEAEEVIDRLHELFKRYNSVTVSDLYELVSLPTVYTDARIGWTDLQEVKVTKVNEGYLLDLPEPRPIPLD